MEKKEEVDVRSKKEKDIALEVLGGIGAVIIAIVVYFIWVNSHAFEGSFFGMTFQMPLESTEHYCNRKAEGILTYDSSIYQSCLKELSSTK